MNRFTTPLALLALIVGIADARADEPYQQWLKYLEGNWQQSLMGRTSVFHITPAAGGHAVLMRSAGDEEVGLIGWQADRKTLAQNLYVSNGAFLEALATEVDDRVLRGTRVVGPGSMETVFKGTNEWRRIDEDRFEIGFDGRMGQAKLAGKIEYTRVKEGGPEAVKPASAPAAAIAEAEKPYRLWLKYLEGDWDAEFGNGPATVFHQKLVAEGRALLNQPDDGGVVLTGWRSDTKSLLSSIYIPNGTHQQAEMTEISADTMSGTCRGWVGPLGVAYTGKEVWRKTDENTYTVDVALDLSGVKYETTHRFIRKKSGK